MKNLVLIITVFVFIGGVHIGESNAGTRESGRSDGFAYRFNLKGDIWKGIVANKARDRSQDIRLVDSWHIDCEKDKFNNSKSCQIWMMMEVSRKAHISISITYSDPSKPSLVCVGNKHFPGSKIQIRVDKNKHHEAPAKSCFQKEAPSLVKEMEEGKLIATRYKKWPREFWIEMEFPSDGLSAAIKLAKRLYGKLK